VRTSNLISSIIQLSLEDGDSCVLQKNKPASAKADGITGQKAAMYTDDMFLTFLNVYVNYISLLPSNFY
jgi:hypothetical protein